MFRHLVQAFALMFVLEGVLPFVLPGFWKGAFVKLAQLSDGQVRFIGLTSLASGIFLLFLFNLAE